MIMFTLLGRCFGDDDPMPRPVPRAAPDQALAAVLRRLREESDESQESVARRAGMSKGALLEIEAGRSSPAWTTVRALAGALGVTLVELGAAIEAEPK
jgi:transcriptional regulator with XRE-family HTH domain